MAGNYTISVKINGDASSFGKESDKAKNKFDQLTSKIGKVGGSFTSIGIKLTNSITKPAVAAAAALGSIALVKGFDRLVGIDTAKAKLMALGNSAKDVDAIMNSALESVKGTSYGLEEAATAAASAVAAGVKPGKDLTKYLSTVGDAAAISGRSMTEMGSIFGKVQTAQRAYSMELNQLADSGIPIYQWLADEAGVTATEVRDMASQGKISSEMFLSAIDKNIGGAAKVMGETSFTGALANMWAALGRVGAAFLDAGGEAGGFFSQMKPLMVSITGWFDSITPKAEILGQKFGKSLASVVGWLKQLDSSQVKALATGVGILVATGPTLLIFGKSLIFVSDTMESYKKIKNTLSEVRASMLSLTELKDKVIGFGNSFKSMGASVKGAATNVVGNVRLMIGQIQQFGIRTVIAESQVGRAFSNMGTKAAVAKTKVVGAFTTMKTSATVAGTGIMSGAKRGAIAMKGLAASAGAALVPFLPLIAVLGVLAAAFAYAWKTDEQFRDSIMESGKMIGDAFAPVVQELVGLFTNLATTLAPVITQLASSLVPVITLVAQSIANIVQAVLPALIPLIQAIIPIIQMIIPVIAQILVFVANAITVIMQYVTPIIQFIVGIIAAILPPIIRFIAVVLSIVGTVIQAIITVIKPIVAVIGGIILAIVGVIKAIIGKVESIFNTVKTVIATAFIWVWNKVSPIINKIASAFGKVTLAVQGVAGGIKDAFSGMIDTVTGWLNTFFRGVNAGIKLINEIPGVNISKIPTLMHGTDDWGGGFAIMNEGGRGELVNLPNGSQVIPHDVSMKYARESAKLNGEIDQSVAFDMMSFGNMFAQIGDRIVNKMEDKLTDMDMIIKGKDFNRAIGKVVLNG